MKTLLPALLMLAAAAVTEAAQAGQCGGRSADRTVALVELYTAQACETCPGADRWLSALGGKGYGPDRVLPIALHVDYRDYVGWNDPDALQAHVSRQRKMARLARAAMAYSPRVLLQGREFRAWGTPEFDREVARINARPPQARIELRLDMTPSGSYEVEAVAELSGDLPGALFVGAYENKPGQDFVVLEWAGPLEFKGEKRLAGRLSLPLLPKAVPGQSGVVAFVQNRANSEVLQALRVPACPG